ncbi:MAG: hypothetical protein ACD_61C00259G0002 [uncultured bacterium]|nr:MAG: hypothetical protein ACD_61C00259G0002 [uncultured bacterium]
MNCPDCNDPRFGFNLEKNRASCPNCNFKTDAFRILCRKDSRGRGWDFSPSGRDSYLISVGNHTVAKMKYLRISDLTFLTLMVFEDGVAWRLVDFFRTVFGKDCVIDVTLKCPDSDTECPVCRKPTQLVHKGSRVVCQECDHFQTDVFSYLISKLKAEGYRVPSFTLEKFSIGSSGVLSWPVADFEARSGVFTLRPFGGTKAQVEKLKLFIESLGLCKRVVVLKSY